MSRQRWTAGPDRSGHAGNSTNAGYSGHSDHESPQHAIDTALVQALIPRVQAAVVARRLAGQQADLIQIRWLRGLKGQARWLAHSRVAILSAKARASAERNIIRILGQAFLDELKARHTKEMPVVKLPKYPPGDKRNNA